MIGTLASPAIGAGDPAVTPGYLACGHVQAGGYSVRTAGPQDAQLISDFVSALSVRTQYFRFFTAVSPPSRGLLRALTGERGKADILLVTDDAGCAVGHGMAVDAEQSGALIADIGVVIADEWQSQGLGTLLLTMLTQRAVARGVAALVLEVLPDNSRMLGIITRLWPEAPRKRTLDAIRITADLTLHLHMPDGQRGRNDTARSAA